MPSPWPFLSGPPGPPGPAGAALAFLTPSTLAGYDASALDDFSIASCGVVNDLYQLVITPSAALLAAVDGVNVLSVTGITGAVWVRQYVTNEPAWYETAWFVDQATGDDANAGTSALAPLKTLIELGRRLASAVITEDTTVSVAAGVYASFSLDVKVATGKVLWFQCAVTSTAPDALVAVTACVPTTNTAAALTTTAAVLVYRDRLRMTSGAAIDAVSEVQTVAGGQTVQVQQWAQVTVPATQTLPVLTSPAPGDTFVVDTLTVELQAVFVRNTGPGRVLFESADCSGVVQASENVAFWKGTLRGRMSACQIMLCMCVLFDGRGAALCTVQPSSSVLARACTFTGSVVADKGSYLNLSRGCAIQDGTLIAQRVSEIDNSGTDLQLVNCTSTPVQAQGLGLFSLVSTTVWGTLGNTSALYRAFSSGVVLYQTIGQLIATTAFANPVIVAAVQKTLLQLPFGDTNHQSAMANQV